MPRIAKSDLNKALSTAAQTIIQAGGTDGRTSRAEMTRALASLPEKERLLADTFFRFIDNRDFKRGAQVTKADVDRAIEYAKSTMIAKYDLNNNGLSKDEIAKMSLTGKRALDLAKALKGIDSREGTRLTAAQLGKEIKALAPRANFTSESDYSPQFFSKTFLPSRALTGENVMAAMKSDIGKFLDVPAKDMKDVTFEQYSARDAKAFIKDLSASEDPASDEAFAKITSLFDKNLTDVKVFKIGPRDAETGKLAQDQGLYIQMVVGRTADGKIAGIMLGDVET